MRHARKSRRRATDLTGLSTLESVRGAVRAWVRELYACTPGTSWVRRMGARGCWVGAGYWWCLLLLRYVSTSVKGRVMNVNSEVQSPCHPSVRVFVFT